MKAYLFAPVVLVNNLVEAVTVLLDEFTDTDSTELSTHAPTPTNPLSLSWVKIGDHDVLIASNKAKAASGDCLYTIDPAVSDCVITMKVAYDGTTNIQFRRADASNYWQISINSSGVTLAAVEDGVEDIKASEEIVWAQGTEYDLTVELTGTSIDVLLMDGETELASLQFTSVFLQDESILGFGFVGYIGAESMDDFQVVG